jgi:hypothetical protein
MATAVRMLPAAQSQNNAKYASQCDFTAGLVVICAGFRSIHWGGSHKWFPALFHSGTPCARRQAPADEMDYFLAARNQGSANNE